MISTVVSQWWSEWGFRLWVMVSLGANVALSLLSGTRRRSTSGWQAKGRMVVVWIIWGSYQLVEKASTSAISGLTLCGSDVSEDEKQLVAFWAAFLLLHLGGPDNLTAYALEDNKLSGRTWLEMMGNVLGVGYAIYKYIYGSRHSRVLLFAASVIISVVGATRYIERVYALSKANLNKLQVDTSSSSPGSGKKETEESECQSTEDNRMDQVRRRIERKQQYCDREALLLAQELFPIWRHAMVDSSVLPGSSMQLASEQILMLAWGSMCKVAEMELSLMYEVIYTKAIVAHTWSGCYYLIRFLSPLFTAAATLLFVFHLQQQQGRIRGSFISITYALLLINFLLDLAWLLRAFGSTWAFAYMQTLEPAWLRHPERWHCLHRFVIRIDPMRWLLHRDPISYRMWSGTIGCYNLLREATTTTSTRCPEWLVPKEMRYLSKLPSDVKGLLFQRVQVILRQAIGKNPEDTDYYNKFYVMDDIRAKWGHKAFDLRNKRRLFPKLDIHHEEAPKFGKEFEEDVLVWHIATCLVFPYIRKLHHIPAGSEAHATAIAVISEYMMFLVAVRRDMLPGLVLHSLYKVIHETLVDIWDGGEGTKHLSPRVDKAAANNEQKLAAILRLISRDRKEGSKEFKGTEGTELLWDAVALFRSLMQAGDTPADRATRQAFHVKKRNRAARPKRRMRVPVAELLEFIFNVWVDKLVYAAVQCSRESHVKQLSAGGDLTTVLWMVIQHAGLFRMGELKPIYLQHYRPEEKKKKEEEKKKKKDGEKKDGEEKPEAELPYGAQPPLVYYLPPYWAQPPPDWAQPQAQLPHGAQPPPDWAQPQPPTMDPTSPPPDEDEDSDDEDTIEYNTLIEYVTLY